MPKSKTQTTDEQARAQLAAIGLDLSGPALDVPTQRDTPQPALAPEGVDPRTMPVSDIVFDPALLDGFPSLEGANFGAASRYVFDLYKSPRKDRDRHRRLHDEIGLFITRTRRSRETGTPHVKNAVRKGKKQTDLLALLAEHGIASVEDLASLLGGEE